MRARYLSIQPISRYYLVKISHGVLLVAIYQSRKEFEAELIERFGSLVKMPLLKSDRLGGLLIKSLPFKIFMFLQLHVSSIDWSTFWYPPNFFYIVDLLNFLSIYIKKIFIFKYIFLSTPPIIFAFQDALYLMTCPNFAMKKEQFL